MTSEPSAPPGEPAPSRHERVKQLFLDALDAPRGRRAAFLASACGGDEQIRREVLELFLLHGEDDPVLDAPLDGAEALAGLGERPEGVVGPYRLLRELGRGGMGVVHLAEREGRLFAVKLLTSGSFSPELRERFRLEAEILGRLEHEGIARIVDVGEVQGPAGVPQPWIAMEYVEGAPLHDYAEGAKLDLRARLALLAAVCDAVQHAHARGIVHRDLKPANILVRADGRPVGLDFGVARLAAGDERPTELLTRTGQLVGTPQYMSPEQVQAEPAGIGPVSDVYSLGIVAYELFAGRLPYEASSVSLHRAIISILTIEPPPLGRVRPELRGPVERIVGMALEKEPRYRYPDAGVLAEDLRRTLAGRAVHARGPGLARRVQRWSRGRQRLVTAISLVLLAGMLVAAWVLGTGRAVPRERILADYREAETLLTQAVPLLYEGERTPSRLRQVIDLDSRARLLIEQVPPLRHHDPLLRTIEKDLGTAQFLLGELTWDTQPYRAAAVTLTHATALAESGPPGWTADIQVPEVGSLGVPQRDLMGLLAAAYLGSHRLWGESGSIQNAAFWSQLSLGDIVRQFGPALTPAPAAPSGPAGTSRRAREATDHFAFGYNSLAEITTDFARFRGDSVMARCAVLYSDSALSRRAAFMQNWPALGSLLFERGRALRTYGALAGSLAALDSSERYLDACADYRGPERPWVFAQTRGELAALALDRTRLVADASQRARLLRQARRDVDSALRVLRPTEIPVAASAALRSLDAELLARLALAAREPALLDSAAARLAEASRDLPSTALPREAAWVCVRQAVLARARFEASGDARQRELAQSALDRARVLMEAHGDSLVFHRIRIERAALGGARAGRLD